MSVSVLVSVVFVVAGGVLGVEPDGHDAREPRRAVYVELGGSALFYAVHYEHALGRHWAVSAGASVLGVREVDTGGRLGWVLQPLMAHYMVGGSRHVLELGAGVTWGLARGDLNEVGSPRSFVPVLATAFLGYRYRPQARGVLVRVGVSPFYGGRRFAPLGQRLQLWGGLSVGYAL